MNKAGHDRKKVSVFDPEERSRAVIIPMLEHLSYEVDEHHSGRRIESRLRGAERSDMMFLHLAVFGDTYQEVTAGLAEVKMAEVPDHPPVLAVSALNLSFEARARLERLGCTVVLSRQAPLMEVMFAVNRLLFPKIRELRNYTRVFGGFPVRFGREGDWREGQVYNLSREGAFIQCEDPPPEGDRIQVRLLFPHLDVPFQVDTLVSWVNPPEREHDPLSPGGMGISFLAMDIDASTTLDRFISAREEGSDPAREKP